MRQEEIDALVYAAADEKYKAFNAKIVNSRLPMIGVRAPYLQKLAKQIARDPQDFFTAYKAENYEQILLYALVLAYARCPIAEKFAYLDALLPKLENWAHVDMLLGAWKDLHKHRDEVLARYGYLWNAPEFQRLFLAVFLMDYCLTPAYLPTVFSLYERMQGELYYVNMGIAWGLSVALVKFYDETFSFLQKGTLNEFVLRKTVQKARESYRVSPERKRELYETFCKKE